MKFKINIYLIVVVLLGIIQLNGQKLLKHNDPSKTLSEKWEWALKNNADNEYWIGYSFEKLMNENSYMGCFSDDVDGYPTLEDILSHKGEKILKYGSKETNYQRHKHLVCCSDDSGKKVIKKIGVLCKLTKKRGSRQITDMIISNLTLAIDLENLSLVWLGNAIPAHSINHLMELYEQANDQDAKKEIIVGISLHPAEKQINDFLKNIIYSKADDELRKTAVFWLGNQELKETPKLLEDIVKNDRSEEVRKEAVFAVSLIDTEEATDVLINIARKNKEQEIRKSAIFWLGQKASKKSIDFLDETAFGDDETEIQKQAVFALSQLEGSQAIDKLIKVAKTHPNYKIRKNAIFWLGQSEDDRALDVIVEFIKGK